MTLKNADPTKLGDPALLHKIDQLFACGVGEYVDLPQLVVVGDQSSGKSSVLEGLTRLPFPRDSGLCTRFATQITFRRAPTKMISVSIRPHVNAGKEHAEKMRGWKAELETLNAESFSKIMAEVHEVMELSGRSKLSDRRTFSNDVLRLEISGPDEDHLSVIDVPGIFKNTTEGVTTKADIDLVRDMVHGYMCNPRSVMLTVVPSNVDIATQEIVEIARELDPNGDRTLGVLTKPDLVDKGAENVIIDMISGKRPGNKVQWSVVRNPGQQDLLDQNTGRQSEAEFFRDRSPWNTLDKDRVGIDALRIRLQEVITTRTRHEFPKVKAEISKRLQVSRQIFNSLGAERDTVEKQRAFLINLVERFQKIVSYAMSANYGADNMFDKPELRIATEVARRSDVFSEQMEKWGHKRQFEYQENVAVPPVEYATPALFTPRPTPHSLRNCFEDAISQDNEDEGEEDEGGEPKIEVRTTADKEDLEDVLHPQKSLSLPGAEIMSWLEDEYRASRGFELGTFGSTLLPAILKEQSKNWDALALGYISDIIIMVHSFVLSLLEGICTEERIKSNLISVLVDHLVDRYRKAREQVVFLLDIERLGVPATLNHYFNDNLDKCRQGRMQKALAGKALLYSDGSVNAEKVVRLNDILQHHPMSNVDHVVRELHDILSSYYKVARKRFVDNILIQATHHMLVSGPDSPLRLLSPSYILSLSNDQLESIAGEDPSTIRTRISVGKEIEGLEKGRKILV